MSEREIGTVPPVFAADDVDRPVIEDPATGDIYEVVGGFSTRQAAIECLSGFDFPPRSRVVAFSTTVHAGAVR